MRNDFTIIPLHMCVSVVWMGENVCIVWVNQFPRVRVYKCDFVSGVSLCITYYIYTIIIYFVYLSCFVEGDLSNLVSYSCSSCEAEVGDEVHDLSVYSIHMSSESRAKCQCYMNHFGHALCGHLIDDWFEGK